MIRKLLLSIGLIVILIVVVGVISRSPFSQSAVASSKGNGWCHAKEVTGTVVTTDPVAAPDGQRFAFIQTVAKYHQPVGICTFPDGGMVQMVSKEIKIYTASLEHPQPQLEHTIQMDMGRGSQIATVTAFKWENNILTIHDWNGDDNGAPAIKAYNFSAKELVDTQTEAPRPDTPELQRALEPDTHLPQDSALRLRAENGKTIGLYRDKIGPNGSVTWDLEKVLTNEEVLRNLNPGLAFYN